MSRIGSSSGVRVAATQLSNVYTVLLLVAALALILSVVFTCITLQKRYASILPIGEAGDKTEAEVKNADASLKVTEQKLPEGQKALEKFLGGAPAPSAAPAETTPATPATPPAETPATPAPEKPATPAPEKPATPAAPAAGEKPAAEKPAAEKPAEAPATPAAEKPAATPKAAETPAAPAEK